MLFLEEKRRHYGFFINYQKVFAFFAVVLLI